MFVRRSDILTATVLTYVKDVYVTHDSDISIDVNASSVANVIWKMQSVRLSVEIFRFLASGGSGQVLEKSGTDWPTEKVGNFLLGCCSIVYTRAPRSSLAIISAIEKNLLTGNKTNCS